MEKEPFIAPPQKNEVKEETVLSDEVIALRPFELRDAEAHLAGEDEEQVKWLGEGKKSTLEGVQGWIRKTRERWEQEGPVFTFAIRQKEGNELMGMIEANTDYTKFQQFEPGDANISYALYAPGRGKGYVGRALKLVELFLKEKDVSRAIIQVEPENVASKNIPIKANYQKIGEKNEEGKTMEIFAKNLLED